MLAFWHDRADHLATVGRNLSCESNAFQALTIAKFASGSLVLISLARVMLFRVDTLVNTITKVDTVLISLARVMLFRGVVERYPQLRSIEVLISLARVMLFRERPLRSLINQGLRKGKFNSSLLST